jgi:hypothetical protein
VPKNNNVGVPESKSQGDFYSSEISVSNEWSNNNVGVPEWSNGTDLRSVSLVLTQVRILPPAFNIFEKTLLKLYNSMQMIK